AVFVPAAGKANAGVAPVGAWFTNVTYQGAFEPGTASSNWAKGWSFSLK
ncbi:MAG: hypothetical protein RIS47_2337, partial [Bacteroidota bacterium]